MIAELYTDYPPSVNNYYVRTQRGMFISSKGKKFRDSVMRDVNQQLQGMEPIEETVNITMIFYVPDGRRRDLDNCIKPLFDALTLADVWGDDCQVVQLSVFRGEISRPDGKTYIRIDEGGPRIPLGMEHLTFT